MSEAMYYKDMVIEEMKNNAVSERKLYLIEEFERESIFKIIRRLDRIIAKDRKEGIAPEDAERITIYIDSNGGCLDSCYGLISVMKSYQKLGYKIDTVAMGRCRSAGFYTLICGTRRYSYQYNGIMVHDQRAFEYGYKTVRDKRVELKEWEKEWKRLISLIEEHTLITEEQIEWYVERGRDWDMFSDEALTLGCIDEII
jgi:ATP-dependent protease ClpP protease subunit